MVNPKIERKRFMMVFWSIRSGEQHSLLKVGKNRNTRSGSVMTSKGWPPMGNE